jgi:hypothetical protein
VGRPRVSTARHRLTGAFRRHPERLRARGVEPQPTGPIGAPPDCLSRQEQAAWREIVLHSPPGVLGCSDRLALEITCRLVAELRRAGSLPAGQMAALVGLLGKLGMTPADRSRVGLLSPEKPKDGWDNLEPRVN